MNAIRRFWHWLLRLLGDEPALNEQPLPVDAKVQVKEP